MFAQAYRISAKNNIFFTMRENTPSTRVKKIVCFSSLKLKIERGYCKLIERFLHRKFDQ